MGVRVYVSEYVFMYMCVYVCIIITCPKTLQANHYVDLWLHSHQQNKQTNKQIKKKFAVVGVESNQFCWGARANRNVLKSPKDSLWSSIDETYHLSHHI